LFEQAEAGRITVELRDPTNLAEYLSPHEADYTPHEAIVHSFKSKAACLSKTVLTAPERVCGPV
jgi:hypothetical protein